MIQIFHFRKGRILKAQYLIIVSFEAVDHYMSNATVAGWLLQWFWTVFHSLSVVSWFPIGSDHSSHFRFVIWLKLWISLIVQGHGYQKEHAKPAKAEEDDLVYVPKLLFWWWLRSHSKESPFTVSRITDVCVFFRFGNGIRKLFPVGWQWDFRLGSFSLILRVQTVPFSMLSILPFHPCLPAPAPVRRILPINVFIWLDLVWTNCILTTFYSIPFIKIFVNCPDLSIIYDIVFRDFRSTHPFRFWTNVLIA